MNNATLLHIANMGQNLLFDSSDSDEEGEKIWGFSEETVPRFNDKQFKQNFRISPSTFETLLVQLHNIEEHTVHSGHPGLTIEKQLMVTLWYLSNMESFRQVGLTFGITKSTAWDIVYRVCNKMLTLNRNNGIIKWPTIEKAASITQGFSQISQFPGVIGAIDGCHIRILKPYDHPDSYINRKGYPSILLQGVCDHRKLFTDVFTGIPGSVHDARLFRMSDLSERIENNLVSFPNNSHLIGDLAYVLSEKLIVGFEDNGRLTNLQRNFNIKLSHTRVVIENAFAWLKGRFRRLKFVETMRQDFIVVIIVACCIMHNVCILEDDLPDYLNLEEVDVDGEEHAAPPCDANSRQKRLDIMYQL